MSCSGCDIGLIGLAVMGQNLVLNMLDHGFKVCVFNRTVSKVDEFVCRESKRKNLCGARTAAELVTSLVKPRKIIILVKAGQAVDDFIEILIPLLEPGDIIIDGGNSAFADTDRRCHYLKSNGLLFVGSGVSGGEEGARTGPSLMPGGHAEAWPHIKNIFQSISAKTPTGEPCCDWVGSGGSGHFVKMVHNGIEYGDMQLISEAYFLLTKYLCLTAAEAAKVFDKWNEGELESYLIQITRDILAFNDESGTPLLEKIRDVSGQKGTGKWTTICGLERGCPITLIAESVFSRSLSSMKKERIEASRILSGPPLVLESDKYGKTQLEEKGEEVELIRRALYASKIVSYAQGFMLLQKAREEFGWDLNLGAIALMWRGGCIIRSRFLGDIKEAYARNPGLTNLLLDPFFRNAIDHCQESWRSVVCMSVKAGIPVPGFSSALAFFDAFRSARLPSNLIQAQRDYFGAHLYELEAFPGTWHHTDWTGGGGKSTSSTYQA
ncbi:6 phosphogluconate dehydrogenase [Echinococcus multilocularis]|uniref:6-phosphogluconate dehydrogenase, decarboxylating n=1 Tax=Echinococcus multilocularis TaxID=6211 RepID=A0A068Y8L0_ECHMU|nr:6 phosphogluconate dehydrogenase [Echinococcus multilocularis]